MTRHRYPWGSEAHKQEWIDHVDRRLSITHGDYALGLRDLRDGTIRTGSFAAGNRWRPRGGHRSYRTIPND